MKIRTNYVSNSSSSSYVINRDLTAEGVECYRLTGPTARAVLLTAGFSEESMPTTEVYLTEPITDSLDAAVDAYQLLEQCQFHVAYLDMQLTGSPYDEDFFVNVGQNVWIHKDDIVLDKLTVNRVAKNLRKLSKYFNMQVNSQGVITLIPTSTEARVTDTMKIANSLSTSVTPGERLKLLSIKANNSKHKIHKKLREFVRASCTMPLTAVMEGRVAAELARMWGLKKNRRRRRRHD